MAGVPFTLNKPKFSVVRTPGADGIDQYVITPTYVPDTSRRYAVRLHPPVTASVDWSLSLDESGSFSDANAKMTDQTVNILASAAKLAVSVAALDRFERDATLSLRDIDSVLQANFGSGTPQIFDETKKILRNASAGEVAAMRATWRDLLPRLLAQAELGKLSDYGYRDASERNLLLTALHLNPGPTNARPRLLVHTGISTYQADLKRRGVLFQILAAYDAYAPAALRDIRKAAIKARTTRLAVLRTVNTSAADIAADEEMIFEERVAAYAKNAHGTLQAAPNEVIFSITDISAGEWAARRLLDLNRQIEERRVVIRASALGGTPGVGSDPERSDPVLTELDRRKAIVLGLLSVQDQAVALDRVSPANPEKFKQAQEMRAALRKQLAEAEAALISAKSTPVAEGPVFAEYVQATAADTPDGNWVAARAEGKPQYVVVLQPVSAAAPAPGVPAAAPGVAQPAPAGPGAAPGALPPFPAIPGVPVAPQSPEPTGKDPK